MLLVLFAILSLAFGASATSCTLPAEGVALDKQSIAGRWWVQVQYGIPPVTDGRCYNIEFSVNADNRVNLLHSWKVGRKSLSANTPTIPPPNNAASKSRTYYYQLPEGVENGQFHQVDYNRVYAFAGCKNGEGPVVVIATRKQERNETLINEITENIAKIVTVPKGTHWTDQTNC